MKRIEDMKLSEKNALYVKQKKKIEKLQNRIKDLEVELQELKKEIYDPVSDFIESACISDGNLKIEAKVLYSYFEHFLFKRDFHKRIGNRKFYSELKRRGFHSKRGNGNKLFIHGLDVK